MYPFIAVSLRAYDRVWCRGHRKALLDHIWVCGFLTFDRLLALLPDPSAEPNGPSTSGTQPASPWVSTPPKTKDPAKLAPRGIIAETSVLEKSEPNETPYELARRLRDRAKRHVEG